MFKIQKIDIWSAAKTLGALYAILGFLLGAITTSKSIILLTKLGMPPGLSLSGMVSVIVSVGAVIIFPIAYGLFGGIIVALVAFFFNLVSNYLGGIKIELVEAHHKEHKTHKEKKEE